VIELAAIALSAITFVAGYVIGWRRATARNIYRIRTFINRNARRI
jgi:hypothetical protein